MTTTAPTITIHMVSSLDGFIAKKDNTTDWLNSTDTYARGVNLTTEDITAFLKNIDCYVMGSHTYEHALKLGWPYGDVPVFVTTSRALVSDKKNVQFHSGDPANLLSKLKQQYLNIWVVGGSKLVKGILQMSLADEVIVSIMPTLLGDGTLFFDFIGQEFKLHLKDSKAYKDGMVEMHYEIKK